MSVQNLPLVSVIIPSYNHKRFLQKTVESVMKQTYKNIQLIVVDDGSTDGSVDLLRELQAKYNFIVEVQQNQGVAAALNNGINKYAAGKYVAQLGSDDYWDLSKIEKQVQFMEANAQYGMCYTRIYIVNLDATKVSSFDWQRRYKSGRIFDDLMRRNFIPGLTVMVRMDVYKEVGLFKVGLYVEDYDLWLRIAYKYQIGFIDERLAYYRIHANNAHKRDNKLFCAEYKIIKSWQGTDVYDSLKSYYCVRCMDALIKVNKRRAWFFLCQAWKAQKKCVFSQPGKIGKNLIKFIVSKKALFFLRRFKTFNKM